MRVATRTTSNHWFGFFSTPTNGTSRESLPIAPPPLMGRIIIRNEPDWASFAPSSMLMGNATATWFNTIRDIPNRHGPIGLLYPTNTTHSQKEGDTMTFLYLVPTGMNDPDQPGWGSWAGRYGLNENFSGQR